jgi:hypothetical protein
MVNTNGQVIDHEKKPVLWLWLVLKMKYVNGWVDCKL